jgi:hypothetical protein
MPAKLDVVILETSGRAAFYGAHPTQFVRTHNLRMESLVHSGVQRDEG